MKTLVNFKFAGIRVNRFAKIRAHVLPKNLRRKAAFTADVPAKLAPVQLRGDVTSRLL